MFEGHSNRTSFGEAQRNEGLRPLRWTDLVARIAAIRELREEFTRHEEGKSIINHAGLTDGKDGAVNVDQAARHAAPRDRGDND